jgi:hypothetical protein
MFPGVFISALLLLSGGSPQDTALSDGPPFAERDVPLDDWGGGGGGGDCVCFTGKRCESFILTSADGLMQNTDCSSFGSGSTQKLVCIYTGSGGIGEVREMKCL